MNWIKRNLFFVIGAVVALGLIGFTGFYNFGGSRHNGDDHKKISNANKDFATPNDLDRRLEPGKVAAAGISEPTGVPDNTARITLHLRAVKLTHAAPDADTTIAYALERELKASPLFDPEATKLGPQIKSDAEANTFTFDVMLALKRPIKL